MVQRMNKFMLLSEVFMKEEIQTAYTLQHQKVLEISLALRFLLPGEIHSKKEPFVTTSYFL